MVFIKKDLVIFRNAMTKDKDIDVVLATYNGSAYIGNFLESLLLQGNVNIHLIVGDDGSQDDTIKIIEGFRNRFASFQLHRFDRIGPSNNFMKLLGLCKSEYMAFADQDDIWEEGRLEEALVELNSKLNPCLIVSPLINLETSKRILQIEPKAPKNLMQNSIHGCSLIFNRQLAELVLKANPTRIKMHDWWTVLVASTFGMIVYSSKKHVKYRIHDDNLIGLPTLRKKLLFFINLLVGKSTLKDLRIQGEELLGLSSVAKAAEDLIRVEDWLMAVSSPFSNRLRYASEKVTSKELSVSEAVKIILGLY
jgi:glycosyltransferase involved in cell wall biosynthesis